MNQPPMEPNSDAWQSQQQQSPNMPYPQQPYGQPSPPKKKSRLWLWIVLGIIGVLLLGCIGSFALVGSFFVANRATTGNISNGTLSNDTTPVNTGTSGNQVGKISQTITLSNGMACTLVSVKTLAADEFSKPSAGNAFFVVHVLLKNTGSSEQDYNPFDFHVKSGQGNVTDESFSVPTTYTGNQQLNAGKLTAGGSVEGDLIFEVKPHDTGAQLTWQPSIFGTATDNAWNLGL